MNKRTLPFLIMPELLAMKSKPDAEIPTQPLFLKKESLTISKRKLKKMKGKKARKNRGSKRRKG